MKKADKGLSSTTLNDGTLPRDRHSSHSIFIIVVITKTDQDQSFADVPISDAGVDTVQFLLASEGLVGLFGKYHVLSPFYTERFHTSFPDLFGSAAFTVVQNDLRGNIVVRVGINQLLQSLITSYPPPTQKVKARYEAVPEQCKTLEALVENEKTEKKRVATEGLMWLLRGLSFTCKALLFAQANKSQELAEGFSKSYEQTLKQFHNFVVKGIFSVRRHIYILEVYCHIHSLLFPCNH